MKKSRKNIIVEPGFRCLKITQIHDMDSSTGSGTHLCYHPAQCPAQDFTCTTQSHTLTCSFVQIIVVLSRVSTVAFLYSCIADVHIICVAEYAGAENYIQEILHALPLTH